MAKKTLAQKKKMLAAIKKVLKENDFAEFKLVEIRLEEKSPQAEAVDDECGHIPCNLQTHRRVKILLPDNTFECACVRRVNN